MNSTNSINQAFHRNLRDKLVDKERKSVRVANFSNSLESKDFKINFNCNGFGRLRHFKEHKIKNWISDPLPIKFNSLAAKALNCSVEDA